MAVYRTPQELYNAKRRIFKIGKWGLVGLCAVGLTAITLFSRKLERTIEDYKTNHGSAFSSEIHQIEEYSRNSKKLSGIVGLFGLGAAVGFHSKERKYSNLLGSRDH